MDPLVDGDLLEALPANSFISVCSSSGDRLRFSVESA